MKKGNMVPLLSKALDIRVRTETRMKEMLKKQLASSRKAHHMSKKSKASVVDWGHWRFNTICPLCGSPGDVRVGDFCSGL